MIAVVIAIALLLGQALETPVLIDPRQTADFNQGCGYISRDVDAQITDDKTGQPGDADDDASEDAWVKDDGPNGDDYVCVVVDHWSLLNNPPQPVPGIVPFCTLHPDKPICREGES